MPLQKWSKDFVVRIRHFRKDIWKTNNLNQFKSWPLVKVSIFDLGFILGHSKLTQSVTKYTSTFTGLHSIIGCQQTILGFSTKMNQTFFHKIVRLFCAKAIKEQKRFWWWKKPISAILSCDNCYHFQSDKRTGWGFHAWIISNIIGFYRSIRCTRWLELTSISTANKTSNHRTRVGVIHSSLFYDN